MFRHPACVGVIAAILLDSLPAWAAQTDPQDVTFTYEGRILEVFDFDTGWWPSGSDIQVRFGASLDGDIESEVEAEHWASWPEAIDFNISGIGHDGWMEVDYGLDLVMQVYYDLGILGSGTYDVPIDDWLTGITNVVAYAEFTPLLLPGHIDRPVEFDQTYTEWTLVEAPIAIATGVTLNLALVLRPVLGCLLWGERVKVSDTAAVEDEGVPVFVPWMDEWETGTPGRVTLPVQYEATLECDFDFELVPEVSICIGTCFDMPEVAIPITVQHENKLLSYDVVDVTYDFPVLQVNDRPIDFGSVLVGDEVFVDLPVYNPGQEFMEVWLSLANDEEGNFDFFPTMSLFVPPGEGRDVRLYFAPGSVGPKQATILLDSDAPANNTAEILVLGTGALQAESPDGWQGPVDIPQGDLTETANCGCRLAGAGGSPAMPFVAFVTLVICAALLGRSRRDPR